MTGRHRALAEHIIVRCSLPADTGCGQTLLPMFWHAVSIEWWAFTLAEAQERAR